MRRMRDLWGSMRDRVLGPYFYQYIELNQDTANKLKIKILHTTMLASNYNSDNLCFIYQKLKFFHLPFSACFLWRQTLVPLHCQVWFPFQFQS